MRDPRAIYDLRYYASKIGYAFTKGTKIVTVPEGRRSPRVENRLERFGYRLQLNLFHYE